MPKSNYDTTPKEKKHKVQSHLRKTQGGVITVAEYLRRNRGVGGGWSTRTYPRTQDVTFDYEGKKVILPMSVSADERISALEQKLEQHYGKDNAEVMEIEATNSRVRLKVVVAREIASSWDSNMTEAKVEHEINDTFFQSETLMQSDVQLTHSNAERWLSFGPDEMPSDVFVMHYTIWNEWWGQE